MNKLQVFENPEFGEIRTVTIGGEPWLVGKDVARALGYGEGKSLANAVANHVDDEDKGVTELMTPGGIQKMTIINESGLYALIFSSKLPKAKEFKHWVTSEVLPSIRKTGGYTRPDRVQLVTPSPPEMSLTGLANIARVARKAMMDVGASRWAAGMEVLNILGYCGLPVPGFVSKESPDMIRLEDFF